jgi:hypothetical protein
LPLPFGDQKRFLLRANTTFSKNVHETLEMAFDARAEWKGACEAPFVMD